MLNRLQYCTYCKYWSLFSWHGFYASSEHIYSHIWKSPWDTEFLLLLSWVLILRAQKWCPKLWFWMTMTKSSWYDYWLQFVHTKCTPNTLNHGRICVWEVLFHKLLQYLTVMRALEWFSISNVEHRKLRHYKVRWLVSKSTMSKQTEMANSLPTEGFLPDI